MRIKMLKLETERLILRDFEINDIKLKDIIPMWWGKRDFV